MTFARGGKSRLESSLPRKMIRALLLLAPLASAYELSSRAGVTPIQKVITLLEDMHAKGVSELKDEQVAFSSFKQWCTDTTSHKQKAIKEAEDAIENLKSSIAKAEADAAQLGEQSLTY